MLGDERVVLDEALVSAGEMSVGDDVGEDDTGVNNVAEAGAGEAVFDKSKDILITGMTVVGLEDWHGDTPVCRLSEQKPECGVRG